MSKDSTGMQKDDRTSQGNAQGHLPNLPITVNAQYIKDISFETPGPLEGDATQSPSINLNIEVRANPKDEANRRYEVDLIVSAEAKRGEHRVFVLELTYAGLFTLGAEIKDQMIPPLLLIECPRLLFPFARSIIAEITREGGYPPLALTPVDFTEIYRQQLLRLQQKQQEGTSKESSRS